MNERQMANGGLVNIYKCFFFPLPRKPRRGPFGEFRGIALRAVAKVEILRRHLRMWTWEVCEIQLRQASVSRWQPSVTHTPAKLKPISEAFRQSPNHTGPSGQPQVTSPLQDLGLTKGLEKHNSVWRLGRSETF